MASYNSTPLFGGALIVDLPSTFADVSCAAFTLSLTSQPLT
jgi:hypothetical protein